MKKSIFEIVCFIFLIITVLICISFITDMIAKYKTDRYIIKGAIYEK
jgi:hypothetical protein